MGSYDDLVYGEIFWLIDWGEVKCYWVGLRDFGWWWGVFVMVYWDGLLGNVW